jgi:hypothetical protein
MVGLLERSVTALFPLSQHWTMGDQAIEPAVELRHQFDGERPWLRHRESRLAKT